MSNPLLEHHELPPFESIKAEHVVPAMEQIIEKNKLQITALLAQNNFNWDNLIYPLEELEDFLGQSFSPVSHMNSVVNTEDMRQAYNASLPLLSEYHTELGQNADLFRAYQSISKSSAYASLDQAQQKSLDNALRDFRLSGIDLDADKQKRFAKISKRLSELSSKFGDNVLDATMAWSKLVTSLDELKGLPDSALDMARQSAEQQEKEGYLFTLEFPSYFPVLRYCENASLRKEMYEAYSTRASDQGPHAGQWDNSEIIQEIMDLRQQRANLLGYNSFAELSLAKKMADDTEQVMAFLSSLAEKAQPVAQQEFRELCDFAKKHYQVSEINVWDLNFYSQKLKQHKFDFSEEALRAYFPAPKVLLGMFEVVQRLYDIVVEQSDDLKTWHPDVTTYNVKRDGQVIARFYLDLYARANKRGGAWMDECRTRRIKPDGELQLPVAYLTCNFSPPLGNDPSLLTHDEVVTLFHEFGHGLHHMMTRISCAPVSGIMGVAWDVVELPSQIMENWCWQEQALEFISGHYQTGEALPKEMLDKMLSAKNFQSAIFTMRQLELAIFDFRIHQEFNPEHKAQIQTILDEVRTEISVLPVPGNNRFQHGFGHIFGGGYAAGYYSYKWAEVLSADAFSKFLDEGIFNRQTGEGFLSAILEQGGSVDAMDMFVEFRGREPSVDALLLQDGIL